MVGNELVVLAVSFNIVWLRDMYAEYLELRVDGSMFIQVLAHLPLRLIILSHTSRTLAAVVTERASLAAKWLATKHER
jgi:hypothetical protein